MLTTSAAYRLALPNSHKRVSRFTVRTPGGDLLVQDVPIGGGSVTAQLSSRVTRTAVFTASAEWMPVLPADPLSPAHAIVRIDSGIEYPSGEQELFPVFTGRVYQAAMSGNGQVSFRADDLAAEVLAADFESPVNSQRGSSCVSEIQRLITQAYPDAVYGTSDVADATVPALTWDDDRGKACDDLASVAGGRWYALGNGAFVVRRYNYDTTTPQLTMTDGTDGLLSDAQITVSADGAYNSIVVTSERPDGGDPVVVAEKNINPNSPYVYGGDFGRRVSKIRAESALSVSEAQLLARSQLAAAGALTRQWSVSCVPDGSLEPGDVLRYDWRGIQDTQVVDSVTYPLDVKSPMKIGSRSSILVSDVS